MITNVNWVLGEGRLICCVCLAVCVSDYLCVIGKLGLKNSPVFCFLELHAFQVDPFPGVIFFFGSKTLSFKNSQ